MSGSGSRGGQQKLDQWLTNTGGKSAGSLVKESPDRCQAIAVDTSEQCQHPAVPGTPYCTQHIDWTDIDADTGE
jgi:hypothetical protein